MANDTSSMRPHHGRNIKRIREIMGVKQEALALTLGNDWTQRRISLLEQKEEVEDAVLHEVAKALNVSPDMIRSFRDEALVNIVSNTFSDFHDNASGISYMCSFNPIEKIIQLYEEKEKLYQEKIELYERLLQQNGK